MGHGGERRRAEPRHDRARVALAVILPLRFRAADMFGLARDRQHANVFLVEERRLLLRLILLGLGVAGVLEVTAPETGSVGRFDLERS
jgi:hypothetical protein